MPSEKLEFTKQEPAFLRKLREQHGGPRNNVQIARPKKDRLRTGDDDEDEPVIVDEAGENVGKEEWEGMLKREKEGGAAYGSAETGDDATRPSETKQETVREEQKVADVGAVKKRKVGKIIAEEGDVEDDCKSHGQGKPTAATELPKSKTKDDSTSSKPKKKAKKIKLSFDEPD